MKGAKGNMQFRIVQGVRFREQRQYGAAALGHAIYHECQAKDTTLAEQDVHTALRLLSVVRLARPHTGIGP